MDQFGPFIRQHLLQVVLFLLGIGLLFVGIIQLFQTTSSGQEVVIVEEPVIESYVVDVAGALESPGVFRLDNTARVSDALIAAGGLSASADRVWVAKFLNQAEYIKDGQKIYVPFEGEYQVQANIDGDQDGNTGSIAGIAIVNVNTASQASLETLKGIGEVRAQAIIANRPYGSLEELKDKANISQKIIDDNEGVMTLY